ncbi:MAG: DUF4214 domain-containing protein, partial [Burkholderiales bacterium]|nr:DUF4214 domain-containing protein [Burkholderiales bacterium]
MRMTRLSLICPLFALLLTACGGESAVSDAQRLAAAPAPISAPAPDEVQVFPGKRDTYLITPISLGFVVTDIAGNLGSVTVRDKKAIQFLDVRVNLEIGALAKSITEAQLNSLIDLYIGFFNRVPDADGLAYWIRQYKAGASLDQIADHFYRAAIVYSAQTGYSSAMTPEEFVEIIYKNVLGRSGSATPTATEVKYWADQLKAGMPRGVLLRSMLASARSFVGDLTWAWVPRILDNKVKASNLFAVSQGLNFNDAVQGMTQSMAIAAAVDVTGTTQANNLMPSKDLAFNLQTAPSYAALSEICVPAVEKTWARAHLDEQYLWYREVVETSNTAYSTPTAYFDSLLVKAKDKFSFTSPQAEIDAYFGSGKSFSYGYSLLRQGTRLRVLFVEPGSPAESAGLKRGETLAQVDGTSLAQVANEVQFAALYPSKAETHSFDVLDVQLKSRTISMTAATVTKSPVLDSQVLTDNGRKFGYMVFNDHIATAEAPLIAAMTKFKDAAIDDLILDLRYNGGGYLYIANEVASMIAGNRVTDKVFEKLLYNDKSTASPALTTANFYQYSTTAARLPSLNLPRVFVLTGSRTCSASESIINGLSPFLQVILVGENTCGKPYGFRQRNNCKTAYFAIQFSGVNAAGVGDYVNGFAPQCKVSDDLDHALGNAAESRLSAALYYAKNAACPAPSGNLENLPQGAPQPAVE